MVGCAITDSEGNFKVKLKTEDVMYCNGSSIKLDKGYDSAITYRVTPNGFDYDALTKKGYSGIKIHVSYKVKYVKDYDVWLDIGYVGAPKYEVFLLNSTGMGRIENNLTTTTSWSSRTVSMSVNFADLENDTYSLSFSTNNIQNIIYFDNIVVTYTCY